MKPNFMFISLEESILICSLTIFIGNKFNTEAPKEHKNA